MPRLQKKSSYLEQTYYFYYFSRKSFCVWMCVEHTIKLNIKICFRLRKFFLLVYLLLKHMGLTTEYFLLSLITLFKITVMNFYGAFILFYFLFFLKKAFKYDLK